VGLEENHGFHLIPKHKKFNVLGLRTSKNIIIKKDLLAKVFFYDIK
jgi:hypothetical protein